MRGGLPALLILIATLPLPLAEGASENLVKNGGFEQPVGITGNATWSSTAGVVATTTSANARSGSFSLAVSGASIGFVRSDRYALTMCQVEIATSFDVRAGSARSIFSFFDARGGRIAQTQFSSLTAGWVTRSARIELPPTVASFDVQLASAGVHIGAFIDDVSLTAVGPCPSPPTACFVPTPAGMNLGVDALCSTDPDGDIASYSWEWGDGQTSASRSASHTYAAEGVYSVRLTVRDSRGASSSIAQDVTITNIAPTACFSMTTTGRRVDVDSACSSDADGTISSRAWDWGDGTTQSGTTATHTYASDGTYTVAFAVTDNTGGTGSATRAVSVAGLPPTACFSIAIAGLAVSVDATCSRDVDGPIVSASWTWGDGTSDGGVASSHTYATPGNYTITLVVTDAEGATGARAIDRSLPSDGVLLSQGWDAGLGDWTVERGSGASVDCTMASDGPCTLRLEAPCCSDILSVSRSMAIDLSARQTLSFDFRATSASGDRDALLQLRFDDGSTLNVEYTGGMGDTNNRLLVLSYPGGQSSTWVTWPKANTWYRVAIDLRADTQEASAEVRDLAGTLVGRTSAVPFTGSTLTYVGAQQVNWSGGPVHYVDRILLT